MLRYLPKLSFLLIWDTREIRCVHSSTIFYCASLLDCARTNIYVFPRVFLMGLALPRYLSYLFLQIYGKLFAIIFAHVVHDSILKLLFFLMFKDHSSYKPRLILARFWNSSLTSCSDITMYFNEHIFFYVNVCTLLVYILLYMSLLCFNYFEYKAW